MNSLARQCLIPWAIVCMFLAGCQANKMVPTAAAPDGNCVGKICDAAGAPVSGATVLLIPEAYTPSASGNSGADIDSTVSSASGQFGFTVEKTGKYNLLASDNSRCALRPSIPINAATRLELPEEKLLAPGSLNGSVRLSSGSGYDSVLALLPGTNKYTVPDRVSGKFSFPSLAQGTYVLRILSMQANVSPAETTVTVVSGNATNAAPISLVSKRMPRITAFTATYDSLMMEAKLFWTSNDTDIISSFNIYCNREKNIIPVKTVGSAVCSATVDLVAAPTDTFTYQIAAVGKDEWEGPAVVAVPFVNRSAVTGATEPASGSAAWTQLLFNKFGVYSFNDYKVSKYNREFTVEKEFTCSGRLANGGLGLPYSSDGSGNLYALFESDTEMGGVIVKFNSDLDTIGTYPFPFIAGPHDISLAAGSDGALLIVYSRGSAHWTSKPGDSTVVNVFDKQFKLKSQVAYNDFREILQSVSFKDTTMVIMKSNAWGGNRIFYYDAAFTIIRIDSSCNSLDLSVPDGYKRTDVLQSCFNDIFFGGFESYENPSTILYFFNNKHEIIARCPGPQPPLALSVPGRGFFSDNNGYVYFIDNQIRRYSVDAVIGAAGQ